MQLVLACDFLRLGKIISFATDTVYGIAFDPTNYEAVTDLYKLKKRGKVFAWKAKFGS